MIGKVGRKIEYFLLFRCLVCLVKRCKPLHCIQRLWVSLLKPHHKPGYLSLRCFLLNALLLAAANYLASMRVDLRNYIEKGYSMYWIVSIISRQQKYLSSSSSLFMLPGGLPQSLNVDIRPSTLLLLPSPANGKGCE